MQPLNRLHQDRRVTTMYAESGFTSTPRLPGRLAVGVLTIC